MPNGCPECPLTVARGRLYTGWIGNKDRPGYEGLYGEWVYHYGASGTDFDAEEPDLAAAFSLTLAREAMSARDRVDPAWAPETAALVAAYRSEAAHVRREGEWAFRQKMRPKGNG